MSSLPSFLQQYSAWASTRWTLYNTVSGCGWISAAASSVVFNGVAVNYLPTMGQWIYSGAVVITWQLSNGVAVGRRTLNYNSTTDCSCSGCSIRYSTSLGAFLDLNVG